MAERPDLFEGTERFQDNLNPIGRLGYADSTLICTPASLALPVGMALGAQAARGDCENSSPPGASVASAGPFNIILEARP